MQNLTTPIQPVTLAGRWARLEPLTVAHTTPLAEACRYPEIWRYLRVELKVESDVEAWIAAALDEQRKGNEYLLPLSTCNPVGPSGIRVISQSPKKIDRWRSAPRG